MARRTKLKRLALLPALALAVSAAACGGGDDPGENGDTVKLVNEGQLTTCTSLPYPPFQDQDPDTDEIVGFDVDLVDMLAEELGVEQEIRDVDFAQIKNGAALNARQCDVAAAGMTVTDERKENLDFAVPYFDETIALMVPTDSGVASLDDVKSENLKLGVQADTTSLDYAEAQGFKPTVFRNAGAQLAGLNAGKVDVVLQDLPTVLDWLKNKKGVADKFEVGGEIETGDQYGYAVKKGNKELLDKLNEVLNKSYEDGSWEAAYEKWIGKKPDKTPNAS